MMDLDQVVRVWPWLITLMATFGLMGFLQIQVNDLRKKLACLSRKVMD